MSGRKPMTWRLRFTEQPHPFLAMRFMVLPPRYDVRVFLSPLILQRVVEGGEMQSLVVFFKSRWVRPVNWNITFCWRGSSDF